MADMAWEKTPDLQKEKLKNTPRSERLKFLVGGLLILGAVAYLLISGTATGGRFFVNVDEIVSNPDYLGQTVRLTGAVIGDTIDYDAQSGNLQFTIANIPSEYDDLAEILHYAANDPNATQLQIFMEDETMPDLLQHEAQAILTGYVNEEGIFLASELNLKCPTRFEEHTPDMLVSATD